MMRKYFKNFSVIALLLMTGLAYAEEPALIIKVDNQLKEDFVFAVTNINNPTSGVASAKQNQAVLTIPLSKGNRNGAIVVYDKNGQTIRQIKYSLVSVDFILDGALAGPDWQWSHLEMTPASANDRKISVTVTKDTDGICADTNLMGCSQTAELKISS